MLGAVVLLLQRVPPEQVLATPDLLTGSVMFGFLVAMVWLLWLLRRLGTAQRQAGGAGGVGWCKAPRAAYGEAVALAMILAVVVAALTKLYPPDLTALQDLPMAKLFEGPPLEVAAMLTVAMLIGPVLEEISFRGIGLGGLMTRLSPLWAAALSSAAFIAAHTQVKIHYLPGFIDVGLFAAAACWLRLRHNSIRPGMLLHVLYNSGGLLVASLLQ